MKNTHLNRVRLIIIPVSVRMAEFHINKSHDHNSLFFVVRLLHSLLCVSFVVHQIHFLPIYFCFCFLISDITWRTHTDPFFLHSAQSSSVCARRRCFIPNGRTRTHTIFTWQRNWKSNNYKTRTEDEQHQKKKTIWICKGIGELPKIICYLCVARPCVCVFVDAGWAVKRCWHRANSSSFRTRTQTHSPMQSSSTDSATQQWDESKKKNILKGRKSSRKLNANI